HPAIAATLQELGWLLFNRGEFLEAAALFRRALAIREQAQGPEHLDVAGALQGLGASLRRLGELSQARPLLESALRRVGQARVASSGASAGGRSSGRRRNAAGVGLAGLQSG